MRWKAFALSYQYKLEFCIQDVEKLRYGLKRKKILRKYRKNGAFCTNIRNYFAPILLHTAKSGLKTVRARGKGAQGVVFALKGPNSPEFLLQLLPFSRYRQKTKNGQFPAHFAMSLNIFLTYFFELTRIESQVERGQESCISD